MIQHDDRIPIDESILNSVKKQLGLNPEVTAFDPDIIMNINMGISTLRQLGVGPAEGFFVMDENQTYCDYLGQYSLFVPMVRMYLFYKTKLSFDPPASGSVMEALNGQIAEMEWRLKNEAAGIFEE